MKILKKLFYLFFSLIVGSGVGLLISNSIDYSNLVQPPLAPPSILFPIAWTIIYLLMGVSYFIYRENGGNDDKVKVIYYIQLAVNALWSIIFFIWKQRLLSIFWIIGLDLLVIYLIYLFFKRTKESAYLNIPYLIWILFATYLTIGIYILN